MLGCTTRMRLPYLIKRHPIAITSIVLSYVATRVTQVARKTEGELLFIIPALAAGTYRLEVRRYYGGNLDQMRDGRLIETLTVA